MTITQNELISSRIFKFAVVSNILEWYEFCVYGFLAVIIGELFFKSESSATSLMYVFLVFSFSYVARPLGSIFFGYIGDKYGRTISLQLSTLIMSIPTVFIGLLPTYNTAGIASIYLLILLRLIQGFAAGGELPTSACIVYENTNSARRVFCCSVVSLSTLIGIFLGSVVATFIFFALEHDQIITWGWRIPFLFGLPITIIIYAMRNYIVINEKKNKIPIKSNFFNSLFHARKEIIIGIIIVGFMQICFYLLFIWMPSYLTTFLNIAPQTAQIINLSGLSFMGLNIFLFGYISKFISKQSLILFSIIGMIILPFPFFSMLPYASFNELLAIQLIFGFIQASITSVVFVFLGDLFANSIRCSGMSISFTCAASFLGGSAPAICTYLINQSGNLMFPAFLMMGTAFMALITILRYR